MNIFDIFNPFDLNHWIILILAFLIVNNKFQLLSMQTIMLLVGLACLFASINYYYNPNTSPNLIRKGYCTDEMCVN